MTCSVWWLKNAPARARGPRACPWVARSQIWVVCHERCDVIMTWCTHDGIGATRRHPPLNWYGNLPEISSSDTWQVLKYNPNPQIANGVGRTAVDVALESPNESVVALLLSYSDAYTPPAPKGEVPGSIPTPLLFLTFFQRSLSLPPRPLQRVKHINICRLLISQTMAMTATTRINFPRWRCWVRRTQTGLRCNSSEIGWSDTCHLSSRSMRWVVDARKVVLLMRTLTSGRVEGFFVRMSCCERKSMKCVTL